jgi:heme oxygenase
MPMTTAERPVRSDFAKRLRADTRAEHERANSQPFVRALLAGELGADAFAELLAQHYFAYEVLEAAGEHMRSDLIAGPFITDRLWRLPALEADLAYYLGPDWRQVIRPSAATEAYRARLREVCFDWPGGFVAHHYTRYFADLSGGQVIRAVMSRLLAPPDGAGFAFLTFDEIPSGPRFKDAYRTLLDTAGWDGAEQGRIVGEVKLAYELNIEVFAELGREVGAAS